MKEKMILKTKKIALDVILLVDELPNKVSSWIIAKQVIRSATSVGANYRAACLAKSKADFINKLKIVEEEADETIYWLEMIEESHLLTSDKILKIKTETKEVLSVLVTSIKTMRRQQ